MIIAAVELQGYGSIGQYPYYIGNIFLLIVYFKTKEPVTFHRFSDCRQSYRQCIEMHGESAERGRESPFCVQSMLIQGYF